jgi:hypothetical protein
MDVCTMNGVRQAPPGAANAGERNVFSPNPMASIVIKDTFLKPEWLALSQARGGGITQQIDINTVPGQASTTAVSPQPVPAPIIPPTDPQIVRVDIPYGARWIEFH